MQEDRQRLYAPVFSLHQDVEGLVNARATFLEEADPTGYKWAIKYLDGWFHWLRLMECSWFKEALAIWLSELEAKLTQESIAKIKEIARSSSPAAFQAAKYLAAQDYRKPGSKRGRPSKQEIENRLREATQTEGAEEADFDRMKPRLVSSNP